ncbi:MAG: isoprenoid biosynthesis glyoxalase ElbB [Myxococcota bacterium]|nr:isoprenoid biosynthesis glyoxalase ElbB [Myxococcota bacterium]
MSDSKRVGVVLAGCGYLDGAEIHEATLTLLSLDKRGVTVKAFAPDKPQMHVVDHQKTEPQEGEVRNVLQESSRITRGDIQPLSEFNADDVDALIFPGGFGAAKNLCNFAVEGPNMSVEADVSAAIEAVHGQGKPLGFICIAPVIGAKVLGQKGVKLTIGHDEGTAQAVESFGAKHVPCDVRDAVLDADHKVASCPAYMLGPSIAPVAEGIDKVVSAVLDWA